MYHILYFILFYFILFYFIMIVRQHNIQLSSTQTSFNGLKLILHSDLILSLQLIPYVPLLYLYLLHPSLQPFKAVSGGTDVLTLSATPIPRTLQMSMANLRDLSLMNTAPLGRKEVNVSVSEEDELIIKNAITAEIKRGGQIFVVVPFVRDVAPTHLR